jgi:hypothetical protein
VLEALVLGIVTSRLQPHAFVGVVRRLQQRTLVVERPAPQQSACSVEALLAVACGLRHAVAQGFTHDVACSVEHARGQALLRAPLQHRAAEVIALHVRLRRRGRQAAERHAHEAVGGQVDACGLALRVASVKVQHVIAVAVLCQSALAGGAVVVGVGADAPIGQQVPGQPLLVVVEAVRGAQRLQLPGLEHPRAQHLSFAVQRQLLLVALRVGDGVDASRRIAGQRDAAAAGVGHGDHAALCIVCVAGGNAGAHDGHGLQDVGRAVEEAAAHAVGVGEYDDAPRLVVLQALGQAHRPRQGYETASAARPPSGRSSRAESTRRFGR